MIHSIQRFLCALLVLALSGVAVSAPFVAPAEENPPFRRDHLPVDTDSMVRLSDSLTLLSQSVPLATAEERRAAAQSLALALALDPANAAAREHISALAEGNPLSRPPAAKLTRALSQIWQIHGWLTTAEAGADGNSLGNLIGDTASVLDPRNPASLALRESPEKGKWDDWIAPLEAFEEQAVATADPTGSDPFADIEPDMPVEDAAPDGKPEIRLAAASLTTVLYQQDAKTGEWTLGPAPVGMVAEEGADDPTADPDVITKEKFSISIPCAPVDEESVDSAIAQPVAAALSDLHGGLPGSGGISILAGTAKSYSYTNNAANLSGPAFILSNAALTGREPSGTVIAELGEDKQLLLPHFFWRLLSKLPEGEGGKLVVPAEAEPYFTALLAAEMPEFFLKYEVLTARTPAEFITLCTKEPSEKFAAASGKFAEIRDKAKGSPTGSYLANRFVRQRLAEIATEAPYHLSAKLLAMQGSGERPRSFPKKVLAAEIWRAVDPIHAVTQIQLQSIDPAGLAALEKLYETTRAEVDRLDRYTDIRDRDLVEKGRSLTTAVRTLVRELRSRDGLSVNYESVAGAFNALTVADTALRAELSGLSGDPLPEDIAAGGGRRNRNRMRNR